GKVFVRVRGAKHFVAFPLGRQLPFGTIIDARHGRIQIVTAVSSDPNADLQSGIFYSGAFSISQLPNGLTTLTMKLGSFKTCARASSAAVTSAAGAPRGKRIRHVWG